jgi:hypothetical protein
MTSASIESDVHLLRGVVPETAGEAAESPLKMVFSARISRFRRLLSKELGCLHDRLVFDDINDVHCVDCGKDFTG